MDKITVGILALQGDVEEHCHSVDRLNANSVAVKYKSDLDKIDGLIIPGGESTTINKLTDSHARSLFSYIKEKAKEGMPIYGTCMGSIMLAKTIDGSSQETLSLMDITVRRNAYGPQKASFETDIEVGDIGTDPFHAIFIRAPQIVETGSSVTVLAKVEDAIVACRQNNFLATTFHPELVEDTRIHKLFLDIIQESKKTSANSDRQVERVLAEA